MEEADSEYDSIMPCELELKIPTTVCLEYFFSQIKDKDVFRQRLEVFRHFPFTLIRETCLEFLLFLHETNILFRIVDNYLVQFWVPVTIGDKRYLITSDQPFHLKEPVHGVCSSRKRCMDYLIPIDDDISTEEEGLLGPPRRAFRNGRAEVSLDFSNYTCTKYPPRSKAVGSAIGCFKALPMQSGRTALKPTQPESWIVVKLVVSYKHILWGVCKRLFEKPEVSLGLPTLVPEIEDLFCGRFVLLINCHLLKLGFHSSTKMKQSGINSEHHML